MYCSFCQPLLWAYEVHRYNGWIAELKRVFNYCSSHPICSACLCYLSSSTLNGCEKLVDRVTGGFASTAAKQPGLASACAIGRQLQANALLPSGSVYFLNINPTDRVKACVEIKHTII